MTPLAHPVIHPDSVVRLAPGVAFAPGANARQFIVHYGSAACGEVELPAGEPHLAELLATLSQGDWTSLTGPGRERQFASTTALLGAFLEQEWLQVARGEAPRTRRRTHGNTLAGVIGDVAAAAADALDFAGAASFTQALLDICHPWKEREVSAPPAWSGLTLDLTPFEFSANFDASGAQLRGVAEPQSSDPSAAGYWRTAMSVSRRLEENWQADLGRLLAVEDLFAPISADVPLAAFFGVGMGHGGSPPRFKVYLSPSASSPGSESRLLARASERLKLGEAWTRIGEPTSGRRRWTLACLDLRSGSDARFKVYETLIDCDDTRVARLRGTTLEEPAAELSNALPPSVRGFHWGMLSYTLAATGEVTYTFGVSICPGARQGLVRQRLESVFARLGVDFRPYRRFYRALAAACDEPVEHSYVTVQLIGDMPRITIYVAPRIYQARFGVFVKPVWPSPVPSFSCRRDDRSRCSPGPSASP